MPCTGIFFSFLRWIWSCPLHSLCGSISLLIKPTGPHRLEISASIRHLKVLSQHYDRRHITRLFRDASELQNKGKCEKSHKLSCTKQSRNPRAPALCPNDSNTPLGPILSEEREREREKNIYICNVAHQL